MHCTFQTNACTHIFNLYTKSIIFVAHLKLTHITPFSVCARKYIYDTLHTKQAKQHKIIKRTHRLHLRIIGTIQSLHEYARPQSIIADYTIQTKTYYHFTHIHTHIHTRTHAYTHTHARIHTHARTHTHHTHTHTNTGAVKGILIYSDLNKMGIFVNAYLKKMRICGNVLHKKTT